MILCYSDYFIQESTSPIPSLLPEILKDWQGKPAHKISCLGILVSDIFVISPYGLSPKFLLYASCTSLSISEENTHSRPFISKAFLKPPTPHFYFIVDESLKGNLFSSSESKALPLSKFLIC